MLARTPSGQLKLELQPLETLDVYTASRVLGVSQDTVRRWCDSRRLPAFKLVGRWRIPRREFQEWIRRYRITTAGEIGC